MRSRRIVAGEAPVSSTSVSTEVGEVPRELMIIFWRNNLIMHASGVAHIWQRIWAVLSTKGLAITASVCRQLAGQDGDNNDTH
ncbi:hypothetical protein HMPREF9611_00524 [Cutibacterium acnes HL063PA1]|nr:hypothetical protein HMPREF9611_00524 [Cutibacterium acnes HL063PA1]